MALALFAAACQPSSLGPRVPAQGDWVTADAGGGVRDARPKDAPTRSDAAPIDAGRQDAGPVDRGRLDATTRDAATADTGAPGCGSLSVSCAPYVCDVDAGRCKATCTSPADCTNGGPCVDNACSSNDLTAICKTGTECLTGFCVDGVCCTSACTGPCRACNLPGALGTCELVPAGAIDPHGICATGSFCDVNGACVPTTCTADQDCGDLELCTSGTCRPCDATCVNDGDCDVGVVCVHRNSCTYCAPRPDAGGDAP